MVAKRPLLLLASAVAASLMAALSAAAPLPTGSLDRSLRSLRVRLNDDLMAPPVLLLGSDDRLDISFDILSDDRDWLRYRLVRCDADWNPSLLATPQWLDGFNEETIDDYEFSRATSTPYVHYSFSLPNDRMRPLLSGNYMVEIYNENRPDNPLARARLMLTEASAPVAVEVSTATDVDYNSEHQQLSVAVDCTNVPLSSVYSDLKVRIEQNGRADNAVVLTTPLSVYGRTARFEHLRPLIFDAGNEYRRFEVTSMTYPGPAVDEIYYDYPYYRVNLAVDQPRSLSPYIYDRTARGRFVVREYNSDRSDVEADYMLVNFRLDAPHFHNTDIYIEGELTGARFDETSRMVFNTETSLWEKSLLLKQGAYNYQYLAIPRGSAAASAAEVEGNRFQTDNEYFVAVYTRLPGERFDRLIGFATGYLYH